jgi:large subunit ribosomal protein L25
MAENAVLNATARAGTGKGAARTARREGLVPGVIYGGGTDPQPINVRFNELYKRLKAGKFLSTLLDISVDGKSEKVICRAVQRDVVKDLPVHVDFLRLTPTTRIALFINVEFINHEASPGLKRGGALTVVRPEVELLVTASDIPDHLTVDLTGTNIGDVITISKIALPAGATPTITGRDFVIANIGAPSGFVADEDAAEA